MFWDNYTKLCKENDLSPSAAGAAIGVTYAAVSKWKKGTIPNGMTLQKIADYFGVSVAYLIDEEETSTPTPPPSVRPTEADIKVALFGGDSEVTDEMWNEVKRFAEFVKQNQKKK